MNVVFVFSVQRYPHPFVPIGVYSTLDLAKAGDTSAQWDGGNGIDAPCNGRGSGAVYSIIGFTVDA
jgi:hypothetical protein